jgi:serine/threonine-protein kinase RsbW
MKTITEYRLRNRLEDTGRVEQWVREFAEVAYLSPAARNAFDVSLVEWLTNVISYGYEDAGEHWISVRFLAGKGKARVEVEDDGREFNPLGRRSVDTTVPLEERTPGGLGIHLIRQYMEALDYRRANGKNLLVMTRGTN